MTDIEKQRTIDLAKLYNSFGCKSIKELSKLSYSKRESGEDIPYINFVGIVLPIKKQKNWLYLDEPISNRRLDCGYTRIGIYMESDILKIVVFSTYKYESGERNRVVLYSNVGESFGDINWDIVLGRSSNQNN